MTAWVFSCCVDQITLTHDCMVDKVGITICKINTLTTLQASECRTKKKKDNNVLKNLC